jgi:hypothetical protein
MNSMPAAMTIALAHQHRNGLLADADRQRLARTARRAATPEPLVLHEQPRYRVPALRIGWVRAWRGAPADTCA